MHLSHALLESEPLTTMKHDCAKRGGASVCKLLIQHFAYKRNFSDRDSIEL